MFISQHHMILEKVLIHLLSFGYVMNNSNCCGLYDLNDLGIGIYIVDSNMNLLWFNDEIRNWFGNVDKSFIDTKCYEFIFDYDKICNNCPLVNLNDESNTVISMMQRVSYDGTKKAYLFRSKCLEDGKRAVLVLDGTDHFETQRMRDDFVATLTHDLRTPLLAAEITLGLLTKGSFGVLNDKQQEVLETMMVSNRELLLMVKNLLEVYRYEGGAKVLTIKPFDLSTLIEECMCDLSPLAEVKNISIKFDIPEVLPALIADKKEIWRVLINLVSNSIEYTPDEGEICINVSLDESSIIIEVRDNGSGIPEKEINNLFKRFSQGTSDSISSGTGLGLYLSRQIVMAHNGRIWASSKPGEGSSFYFSLPL